MTDQSLTQAAGGRPGFCRSLCEVRPRRLWRVPWQAAVAGFLGQLLGRDLEAGERGAVNAAVEQSQIERIEGIESVAAPKCDGESAAGAQPYTLGTDLPDLGDGMRPPLRDATSCASAMTQSGQRLITWEGEVSRSRRLPAPVALAHARGHRADFWLAKFVVNEPLKPDLF